MVTVDDRATEEAFTRVRKLGSLGKDAATKLGSAHAELQKEGASAAAERVKEVDTYIDQLDYSGLETRVDPELASEELSAQHQKAVRRAHIWRNIWALAPLLITWVALSWASREYRVELGNHPGEATQPFLLLWERGFGHQGLWYPTFAKIAALDFVVLLVVVWLTWEVHRREGAADRRRTAAMHSLWIALDALKSAVDHSRPRPPATAEEWADAARNIISDAMQQTKLLADASRLAIEEASARLAGIQDQGRDFIAQFSVEIQRTLVSVREQNEQFIQQTARESRETLRGLVEQEMDPLLAQLRTMLDEFGRHQDTYRQGVADLSQGVSGIRGSAQELADSARAYNSVADSVSTSLESMTTAQQAFVGTVSSSAASMATAATAMNGVSDVLRAELRDGVRQMADNVSSASGHLATIERQLADTSTALDRSAKALGRVTADLRAVIGVSVRATTSRPRRLVGRLFGWLRR